MHYKKLFSKSLITLINKILPVCFIMPCSELSAICGLTVEKLSELGSRGCMMNSHGATFKPAAPVSILLSYSDLSYICRRCESIFTLGFCKSKYFRSSKIRTPPTSISLLHKPGPAFN